MKSLIRTKSMKAYGEKLASPIEQLNILEELHNLPNFDERYKLTGENHLRAGKVEILQINLGKMCNQVCKHCHVDAGPDRKEIMTRETMELCLEVLRRTEIATIDLTGGAPELNPNFKWFVAEIKKLNKHILVRSNLTILRANGFEDFAGFMAENDVEIISSLPYYKANYTNRQRGEGVFEQSIEAIKRLNELGYGKQDSGLVLNLVYNPVGAFLPPEQQSLEEDYKRELLKNFGVSFNHLFTITNMPISRYLDYLLASGNFEAYMNKLTEVFNPAAAYGVMCKFTLSVGWDGYLYDCDFNQMLELKVCRSAPIHISEYDEKRLEGRKIVTGIHCFGCTAGSGSSCGGATV